MAANKITIKFNSQGERNLLKALKNLAKAQDELTRTTKKYGKAQDNTAQIITEDFLVGTSANISIGDGSTIDFDIPTAKYTGHTQSDTENGVFVELPFAATAEGSGALVTIDVNA